MQQWTKRLAMQFLLHWWATSDNNVFFLFDLANLFFVWSITLLTWRDFMRPNTVQWETFFWQRIAPPIWYAFSESWWYVDYYSKIEKVGCPESLLHKISKNRFMHKSQSLKKYFFSKFVHIFMFLSIGLRK